MPIAAGEGAQDETGDLLAVTRRVTIVVASVLGPVLLEPFLARPIGADYKSSSLCIPPA